MDMEIFDEAVKTLLDYDGFVVISGLDITLKGTLIDCLEYRHGKIIYYAGNPDEDEEWEELLPTDNEAERILIEFNELF